MNQQNSWVEISQPALINNLQQFKKIIKPGVLLLVPVKANAYGHGLIEIAKILVKNKVDWLGVNNLAEAVALRENRIRLPILVLGYVKLADLRAAARFKNLRLVVYNLETIKKMVQLKLPVKIHLKLETGTNRQGILPQEILPFIGYIRKYHFIQIEGLCTHFANIEDTTNHQFAFNQLKIFNQTIKALEKNKIFIPLKHAACSAATVLYQQTHFNLVRPGISIYGLWSSKQTLISSKKLHHQLKLKPVLSWKTMVVQIKKVKKNSSVGYGCSEKALRHSQIAVIPVGYWDGYSRGLSNIGNVLIHGQRAKIIGRICMNMLMADVTDIAKVKLEDEVVLIGRQAREEITADELAEKLNTINYEIVTRINPLLPRIIVK